MKVYIVKTSNRVEGIQALFEKCGIPDLKDKKVIIKPNFNSDDPFPATTHIDTLKTVIQIIKTTTPESITITERSGMGDTDKVLKNRGVYTLAEKEKIEVVNLDALDDEEWARKGTTGTHWKKGYLVPKIVLDADYVINLPCLKTHRFGGDFTMSLKNNVGLVAKWHGDYNYMWELHSSLNQRLMIAEINKDIPCHLIITDGIRGFSTGGPEKGKLIEPEILLLSTDRVAMDAVGVAVLRIFGTTEKVSQGKIFDQEQIKRAAELGIGVKSPEEIELVAVNPEAKSIIEKIEKILR
ncbi:hypothetical protein AMJ44_11635 [candidate division WOR-1 bacterium DG_54_3]|uniref:DUF362 domain-containing protein n=1 Tax=candidate division WOR-1 bacterium DG_54_3 TaxID=1703775 RepID=A0A0S7XS07_UNCSA|nr:MAG: hypothetical protein AMJ44_11635 [candidate division WOR-1 bacterium DG_54_3]